MRRCLAIMFFFTGLFASGLVLVPSGGLFEEADFA